MHAVGHLQLGKGFSNKGLILSLALIYPWHGHALIAVEPALVIIAIGSLISLPFCSYCQLEAEKKRSAYCQYVQFQSVSMEYP